MFEVPWHQFSLSYENIEAHLVLSQQPHNFLHRYHDGDQLHLKHVATPVPSRRFELACQEEENLLEHPGLPRPRPRTDQRGLRLVYALGSVF
eukprot:2671223-Prymnesium_polylepis.1